MKSIPRHYGRDLRLITVTALLGAAATVLLSYVFHAALPFNPVNLPSENSVEASMWSPQGWKFFTRNPREDWMIGFSMNAAGKWAPALPEPNFSWANSLGVGRGVRAQGIELAMLVHDLPKAAFHACQRSAADCLAEAPVTATLKNRTPEPALCGAVGIVMQQQLPWAWALRSGTIMPSRVTRLEVKC